NPAFNVTAAQSKEVATLLTLAQTLRIQLAAITPDACALQRFLPRLAPQQQCLAWRDDEQWLWATRYAWGRKSTTEVASLEQLTALLALPAGSIAICGEGGI
ncbi:DNA utilization protein HofM, partial [Escherichia coli]